ncbi:winged helix-turn-helix domain-containing protein [Saccharopolyspora flava]|uniref:Transposase n=1 Tax=Saccharopolyspora flava TaxID=95161 RepID=A0A1I6SRQ6_9PSEU|nr:winged helix-turn-helix domain-containing protein [Saccharopolyspora flava]SFS79642.1 Transposase [Saccharopolyspora flava]
MNVRDVRKISAPALEDLRRRVVAAVDSGASQVEAARVFGVSRPTVNRWVRAYQANGEASFRPRKRGRRTGMHRVLTDEDQDRVLAALTGTHPDDAGLDAALWTRHTVAELIDRTLGVRLTPNTVSSYLRRWGLIRQEVLPRAAARNPRAITRWRRHQYPLLARMAHLQDAAVFWMTCTEHHDLRSLSAVSTRRSVLFSVHTGPVTADSVIAFLERLEQHAGRPIVVVVDLFPIERPRALRAWLADNRTRINAIFPLARHTDAPPG